MKIITYTVNLGKYDEFRDSEHLQPYDSYYVTDCLYPRSRWEYVLVNDKGDLKRKAGRYKINSHHMPDHQVSIYMDASVQLKQPISSMLPYFLNSKAEVMIPRHPKRGCTYQEAEACKRLGLDDPNVIDAQMERYRSEGFPSHYGMVATTIVLRRNTPQVQAFNEMWHRQCVSGSRRDQLSVMYALWKTGVPFQTMPLNIYRNPYFRKCRHKSFSR